MKKADDVAEGRRATYERLGEMRNQWADHGIGVRCEREFGRRFDLRPHDLVGRGDGGIDFVLSTGLTIDVKGAANPTFLVCELSGQELAERGLTLPPGDRPCPPRADALVLAGDDGERSWLIGWMYRAEMLEEPVRTLYRGIYVHVRDRHLTRPIWTLLKIHRDGLGR